MSGFIQGKLCQQLVKWLPLDGRVICYEQVPAHQAAFQRPLVHRGLVSEDLDSLL
jgi:hypothetical protein